MLKDIAFNSHCEHHMVPIEGKVHLAYIPVKKVVGISKLARVVDIFAKTSSNTRNNDATNRELCFQRFKTKRSCCLH